jgi:hypothetical protein
VNNETWSLAGTRKGLCSNKKTPKASGIRKKRWAIRSLTCLGREGAAEVSSGRGALSRITFTRTRYIISGVPIAKRNYGIRKPTATGRIPQNQHGLGSTQNQDPSRSQSRSKKPGSRPKMTKIQILRSMIPSAGTFTPVKVQP